MKPRWQQVLNAAFVFLSWFILDHLSRFSAWATYTWCAVMIVVSAFIVWAITKGGAEYTSLYPKRLRGAYYCAVVMGTSGMALLISAYLLRASATMGTLSLQGLSDILLGVCGICLGVSINLFWMCLDLA